MWRGCTELNAAVGDRESRALAQVGTPGGGNHFVEVCVAQGAGGVLFGTARASRGASDRFRVVAPCPRSSAGIRARSSDDQGRRFNSCPGTLVAQTHTMERPPSNGAGPGSTPGCGSQSPEHRLPPVPATARARKSVAPRRVYRITLATTGGSRQSVIGGSGRFEACPAPMETSVRRSGAIPTRPALTEQQQRRAGELRLTQDPCVAGSNPARSSLR